MNHASKLNVKDTTVDANFEGCTSKPSYDNLVTWSRFASQDIE